MRASARASARREERLDEVFKALSDRTRRAMLNRLAQGALPISELAAPFDMSLPGASKHVRVLERAGLVRRNVEGRVHRCAIDPEPLREASAWVEHYRAFWEGQLDALARFVESEDES